VVKKQEALRAKIQTIRECVMTKKNDSESIIWEIRRKTTKKYSAEEKIRIVLDGLRSEGSIRKRDKNAVVSLNGTSKDRNVYPQRRTGAKTAHRKTNGPTTKTKAWHTQVIY
jgi:hypothetical protein